MIFPIPCRFSSHPGRQFYSRLASLLVLMLGVTTHSAAQGSDDVPDLYASFDNTVTAMDAQNKPVQPEIARGLKFVDGIKGHAVYVGGNGNPNWDAAPLLQYPAQSLITPAAGAIMFWVRPDWDGGNFTGDASCRRLFSTGDNFDLFMYAWLRWDISGKLAPPKPPSSDPHVELQAPCRAQWLKGDWEHVALSWDSNGWTKLYVNGLPYATGWGNHSPQILRGTWNFPAPKSISIGSTLASAGGQQMRADAAFTEFKIYRHPLTDVQVMAEYRRFMPLDMVMERRFLRSDGPDQATLDVWPGGQILAPPIGDMVKTPVKVAVDLKVITDSGTIVSQKHYDLSLDHRQSLSVPVAGLKEDSYRLVSQLSYGGGKIQSSFVFFTYKQQPAPIVSDAPAPLGDPVLDIDCTNQKADNESLPTSVATGSPVGSYREASPKRDGRFDYVLDLAKAAPFVGQPMMLEIYWPDDKPRSMGLYLYRPSVVDPQQRDRLEGGTQSGNEYDLTNKTQVSRYIIYPWMAKYLFEARTMVENYPAAVSRIVVRPIVGRLPKLNVQTPTGLPQRHFGHFDEDQSFDVMLAYDMNAQPQQRAIRDIEMLLDYLDYTGQDTLNYSFIRYADLAYELPGNLNGQGASMVEFWGVRDLMLDMFQARGKKLNIVINEYTIQEGSRLPYEQEALEKQNYFQRDRYGNLIKSRVGDDLGNPLNPLFRSQFMGHIDEILRRFGSHPALAGIDLWNGDWQIQDLNTGYDDLTVSLFAKETQNTVPGGDGPDRFENRYTALTGPLRKPWVAWRAAKNTEFIREVADRIHRANPALTLNIIFGGTPSQGDEGEINSDDLDFNTYYLEEQSLDAGKLRALPGVVVSSLRQPDFFRWQQHWNGNFTSSSELLANMKQQSYFRSPAETHSYSMMVYFESFNNSLDPGHFNSLFQNSDVKAYGRNFLQETAECMAASDPSMYLVGGQPLGTNGRDDETREFTKAYRALPVGAYTDIEKLADPVCGRYLSTAQGIYFYLQNQIDAEVNLSLKINGSPMDLSTGQSLPAQNGGWTTTLRPFELKAFRLDAGAGAPQFNAIQIPDEVVQAFRMRSQAIAASVKFMDNYGADVTSYTNKLKALNDAITEGRFAEAHRLAYSVLFRQIDSKKNDAKLGYLNVQRQMIASGRYGIHCGSTEFHQAGATLFFPDQKYSPGGYGYVGSHSSNEHDVSKMKTPVDLSLIFNEASDVEGYNFTVPNGKYTVRLYNRIGYEPDAVPGRVVMTLEIQGKRVWDKMDLFEALKGDMTQALVSDFKDVEVKDGILHLNWIPTNDSLGWVNAIEIIPQQGI